MTSIRTGSVLWEVFAPEFDRPTAFESWPMSACDAKEGRGHSGVDSKSRSFSLGVSSKLSVLGGRSQLRV